MWSKIIISYAFYKAMMPIRTPVAIGMIPLIFKLLKIKNWKILLF